MDLNKELAGILATSTDKLWIDVSKIEKNFSKQVFDYAKKEFETDGRKKILNTRANKRKLIALQNAVKNFDLSENRLAISAYLRDVEKIQKINFEDLKNQTKSTKIEDYDFSEEKILFDDTFNALTDYKTFSALVIPEMRQTLFKGIVFNQTYDQLGKEIQKTIDAKGDGALSRYVKQISRDAINQFDGQIQQKAAELYNFNAFRYVNPLLTTSRDTCVGLVNGSGEYAKFLIPGYRDKAYLVKDLPAIIKVSENNSGWIAGTTAANFATYRGGYACRHKVIYFMYVE